MLNNQVTASYPARGALSSCEAITYARVDPGKRPAIFRRLRDAGLSGKPAKAPVAELVDALDSKSSSARSAGSIPARGTNLRCFAASVGGPSPSDRAKQRRLPAVALAKAGEITTMSPEWSVNKAGALDWGRHMRNIVDEAGEIIAKATDDHTLIGGHHRLAVAASLGQKLFWKHTGEPVKLDPFFKGSSHRNTA